MEKTPQEKMQQVQNLRPIDDVFFECLAQNEKVCEEIIRTILEDDSIEILNSITQSSEHNLYGRSVRLDALCKLGNNSLCNIEVQRSNNDNHIKRVRYNESMITCKNTETGDNFDKVIDVKVIYVSEFDIFKEGKTVYHIDKTIRETNTVINDGTQEVYVNTAVNDGTKIAKLMSHFIEKEVNDTLFPNLSKEMNYLKHTEGGASAVCEVMEKYQEAAVKAADKEATIRTIIEEGIEYNIDKVQIINRLMIKCNLSEAQALEKYNQYAPVSV